jgi:molecular chaperone GrpE
VRDDMAKKKEEKISEEEIKDVSVEQTDIEENSEEVVEELKEGFSEIEKVKAECKEINEKYLRLQAEFQNYKKRTEKEKVDLYKYANEKVFADLLPLMDNMERALASTENGTDGIVEGLKMIKKSFNDVFDKSGIKVIDAMGAEFDPELHHAVMSDDSDDHKS